MKQKNEFRSSGGDISCHVENDVNYSFSDKPILYIYIYKLSAKTPSLEVILPSYAQKKTHVKIKPKITCDMRTCEKTAVDKLKLKHTCTFSFLFPVKAWGKS